MTKVINDEIAKRVIKITEEVNETISEKIRTIYEEVAKLEANLKGNIELIQQLSSDQDSNGFDMLAESQTEYEALPDFDVKWSKPVQFEYALGLRERSSTLRQVINDLYVYNPGLKGLKDSKVVTQFAAAVGPLAKKGERFRRHKEHKNGAFKYGKKVWYNDGKILNKYA